MKLLRRIKKTLNRIFVILLVVIILTVTIENKESEVKATSIVVGTAAYTAYEICLYLGSLLVTSACVGAVVDNKDALAEVGKEFVDTLDLNELPYGSDIILTVGGNAIAIDGTSALENIQETEWTVIQGGAPNGEEPDNNGKTTLQIIVNSLITGACAISLGSSLGAYISTQLNDFDTVSPLVKGILGGTSSVNDIVGGWTGSPVTSVVYNGTIYLPNNNNRTGRMATYINSSGTRYLNIGSVNNYGGVTFSHGSNPFSSTQLYDYALSLNAPFFDTSSNASNYILYGTLTGCLNLKTIYQATTGSIVGVQTAIANALTKPLPVSALATAAMYATNRIIELQPGVDTVGQIIIDGITNVVPLPQIDPITEQDAVYLPEVVPGYESGTYPGTIPDTTPGNNPITDLDPEETEPDTTDPSDPTVKKFGGSIPILNGLLLLILILIQLLLIFLSCLVFIINIFKIPATTGFLPEGMIQGFQYLKTLMIPRMNISVYDLMLTLIYFILICNVIRFLRREINHIKLPKG